MANKYAEFCGWCEAYISEEDLENNYYKTLLKKTRIYNKGRRPRILDVTEWIICIKCLGKFAYIRTLKEKK